MSVLEDTENQGGRQSFFFVEDVTSYINYFDILFVFSVLDVEPEGSCLVGNFHAIQLHTIFENLEKNSSHQLIIYQKILVYFIFKRSRICINSASHASLIWSTLPNHDIKQTICRHKYYLLICKDQVSHMLNYIKY